ncbi:MAG TPA: restriction endonuclease [Caulobacteraceae bacterium]|nr:restriction endonuclease [Caulobacteraceae bacterium]
MSIPDYQTLMLPLLRAAADAARPLGVLELQAPLAAEFRLTPEELAQRLPSGRQGVFHNRLHWAKFYMQRAGLLEPTKRGLFQVTARGRALLASSPARIDNGVLARYPEFATFLRPAKSQSEPDRAPQLEFVREQTPEDLIDAGRRGLDAKLKLEVLDRVKQMDPGEFEDLIITLLVRMGYGQGRDELAQALGGSGDGGVDGVINQDPLGLDRVYIQAKRYRETPVGPDTINSFIGALNIKRASKGLFVTASTFSRQALTHVASSTIHVVTIDGERLAELMVRHGVGVVVRDTVEIKAIDEGFFAD